MTRSDGPGRFGPPHNPAVRELVANKRRWSSPPKREHAMLGFRGWHERGYLPHRDEPGLVQFVTSDWQIPFRCRCAPNGLLSWKLRIFESGVYNWSDTWIVAEEIATCAEPISRA